MDLYSSTNLNNRKYFSNPLYLEISIGTTRVFSSAHRSIDLLMSQQLCLLSTEFSQHIGMLRAFLVKQGFFLSLNDKFILNEPGYSGMLLISVKAFLSANGDVLNSSTYTFSELHLMSHKRINDLRMA